MSFEDRVACQSALEAVFWRHRIWPRDNVGPKLPFEQVMPRSAIERKVRQTMATEAVLSELYHQVIGPRELQIELDRMRISSRNPRVLAELLAALGGDDGRAAECLARPTLVERLHRLYASARRLPSSYANGGPDSLSSRDSSSATESMYGALRSDTTSSCSEEDCVISYGLSVPDDRYAHTAVWTGAEMVVWGGRGTGDPLATGGRYTPATDTWSSTSLTSVPSARSYHSAVWTGTEMLIWGGGSNGGSPHLNSGARYDPAADAWSPMSGMLAPSPRSYHTAVWTGTEMIVWGGSASGGGLGLSSGGRYDPSTDSWSLTNTASAPDGRLFHTAVWTGTRMLIWGGWKGTGPSGLDTGGRYDPSTDTWSATSVVAAPSARNKHTAVWTGSEMVVWGGRVGGSASNQGGRYDPLTDSWQATSLVSPPSPREGHSSVWTGTEMIVWGGKGGASASTYLQDGRRYNPAADSWVAITVASAPSKRQEHSAVWAESEMVVWGGETGGNIAHSGGRYLPSLDSWSPIQSSLRWVALGDSYSSGEGAGPYLPETNVRHVNQCHRSVQNAWSGRTPGGNPSAQVLPAGTSGALLACSGARSKHLLQPRFFGKHGSGDNNGNGVCDAAEPCVPPQLDEAFGLTSADVVTITTGGNDLAIDEDDDASGMFATLAFECVASPFCTPGDNYGDESLGAFALRTLELLNADEFTSGSLRNTYKLLKERAPNAAILVLSYPKLFRADPVAHNCADEGFDAYEMAWLNWVTEDLQRIVECAAKSQGVRFVPVSFGDNALCANGRPAHPWLHGVHYLSYLSLTPFWPWYLQPFELTYQESLHPNYSGQIAIANALRAALPRHEINNPPPEPCEHTPGNWIPAAAKAGGTPTHGGALYMEADIPGCGASEDVFTPGQLVNLEGRGFAPLSSVSLRLKAAFGAFERSLGTTTADPLGAMSVTVTLPADSPQSGLAKLAATGATPNGETRLLQRFFVLRPSSSADSDGDSVPDICDNCASVPNEQVDADEDGLGDACDLCAVDPLNDGDGDGLCAQEDSCPLDPANDVDGDGLCAELDSCPAVAGMDCIFGDGFEAGSRSAWFDAIP